jgi:tRNA U38,U39,U40 pseudouridine synthase TruA
VVIDYTISNIHFAKVSKVMFPNLVFDAGAYLVGEHDFRNFCKMDVGNGVVNYHRRITSVTSNVIQTDKSDDSQRFSDFSLG